MILFLTSSPFGGRGEPFTEKNQFAARFREAVGQGRRALLITSDPEDLAFTEEFAFAVQKTMELTGITLERYCVLDGRNAAEAEQLVQESDLIILAGGHVPTQNRFFQAIRLKERMQAFDGVVLGISAGSMNSADLVYAQPELAGEAADPEYVRFLHGLALTDYKILPHYQDWKDQTLDGQRILEEITYPDSMGRQFVALPDGSYLYGIDGEQWICGEAWLIQDGVCTKINEEKGEITCRSVLM